MLTRGDIVLHVEATFSGVEIQRLRLVVGIMMLVTGYVVFPFGLAPAFTQATDLIVGTVPSTAAGAASGLAETGSELGGALGIAILGSIVTAVCRGHVFELLAEGATAEAIRTARETLGGAAAVASTLPASVGQALLGTARHAFVLAFYTSAGVGAAVALVAAVLAGVRLRNLRPDVESANLPTTSP